MTGLREGAVGLRDILAAAACCSELHVRERVLMAYMAHWNAKSGMAWPAKGKVARALGCSLRMVRKSVRELEAMGQLRNDRPSKGGRTGGTCMYTVGPGVTPETFELTFTSNGRGNHQDPPSEEPPVPPRGNQQFPVSETKEPPGPPSEAQTGNQQFRVSPHEGTKPGTPSSPHARTRNPQFPPVFGEGGTPSSGRGEPPVPGREEPPVPPNSDRNVQGTPSRAREDSAPPDTDGGAPRCDPEPDPEPDPTPPADPRGTDPDFHLPASDTPDGYGLMDQVPAMLEAIAKAKIPLDPRKRFRTRNILASAIAEGLTLEQLTDLTAHATKNPRNNNPAGLLLHWLEHPGRWKDVLLDVEHARKPGREEASP